MKPTLLVLAAGLGTRYGGLKQIDAIGPHGQTIIDYSIYDGLRAGFGKVVFVIRHYFEEAFKAKVSRKFEGFVEAAYAYQELDACLDGFPLPAEREKPWGTGHAILVCRGAIEGPFAVVNADDYYGRDSLQKIVSFLTGTAGFRVEGVPPSDRGQDARDTGPRPGGAGPNDYAMVGYTLRNTLSEYGTVARGVAECDEHEFLERVVERKKIERTATGVRYLEADGTPHPLTGNELVSMNLWGFEPSIFGFLESQFAKFLAEHGQEKNSELYIPFVVDQVVTGGKATVKVLPTEDTWFGVTYRADKSIATACIRKLIDEGVYPERLWAHDHPAVAWFGVPPSGGPEPRKRGTPNGRDEPRRRETISDLGCLARRFHTRGEPVEIAPVPVGHINDTFIVTTGAGRYVLQRINQVVFKNPVHVMANIVRITEHIRAKTAAADPESASRQLEVVATKDGGGYHRDADGNVWRMYNFIENAVTYDCLQSAAPAREAARMFGWFQRMLIDLPGPPLHETILGFHNTPRRLEVLQEVLKADVANRAKNAKAEIDFVFENAAICHVLSDLVNRGEIPVRIAHNDAKINNCLLDTNTGQGVCIIDLDTVMPGLSVYDFGDLVRTATCAAAEDERDLSKVAVDVALFDALAQGFVEETHPFLTPAERRHLVFGGKLITFEQLIRFLTDYLAGDVYYKVHREGHNLDRSRTQMKLTQSIIEQEEQMNRLVDRAFQHYSTAGITGA